MYSGAAGCDGNRSGGGGCAASAASNATRSPPSFIVPGFCPASVLEKVSNGDSGGRRTLRAELS